METFLQMLVTDTLPLTVIARGIDRVSDDRGRTTMGSFPMCAAWQAEYHDPADRRFHAQLTACPACGLRLQVTDAQERALGGDDLLNFVGARLREGGEQLPHICRGRSVALMVSGHRHL